MKSNWILLQQWLLEVGVQKVANSHFSKCIWFKLSKLKTIGGLQDLYAIQRDLSEHKCNKVGVEMVIMQYEAPLKRESPDYYASSEFFVRRFSKKTPTAA